MRTLLTLATALACLTGPAALADTRHDSPQELQLHAAERQASTDSLRVHTEADETVIAERDLDSSRLQQDVTSAAWQRAIKTRDRVAAGRWAVAHYDAMVAERDAQGRYEAHRAERDIARADFRRDADLVRMLQVRLGNLSAMR